MGYDLHITRAFVSYESERFPILASDVDDLVRTEPDLVFPPGAPRRPDFCFVTWMPGIPDGHDDLVFQSGRLQTKNPRPEFRRRMIDVADRLDAWLIGDDGEVYSWDGDQVVARQRATLDRRYITRESFPGGSSRNAPILPAEWSALAATEPDLATLTHIEATLPSGVRRIPCPPVTCWTAHPSGRPVPFFFDEDLIEVQAADKPTTHRMTILASALNAKVLDDNGNPV